MLIGNFESVGISQEQADKFNDGIKKIGMLQNILHVLSTLELVKKKHNSISNIDTGSLQNLFMDMEDMTVDILSIYDEFEINSITKEGKS